MNQINFFQIGLGLLPAVVGMLAIVIKRKAWKRPYIATTGMTALLCVAFFCVGIFSKTNANDEKRLYKDAEKDLTISMCYALIAQGDYELAEELIEDYMVYGIYDKDVSLLKARMEALKGNPKESIGIIRANALKVEETEEKILASLAEISTYDTIIADFAESEGIDIEEVVSEPENSYTQEDVEEVVLENIKEQYDEEDKKAAQTMIEVEEAYEMCVQSNMSMQSSPEVQQAYENLEKTVEDNPELENLHAFRIIRLKSDVMAGHYEEAVKRLQKDSFYDEYMVASELLVNGFVDKDDFSEDFYKYSEEDMDEVTDQLEVIAEEQKSKLSNEEYEDLLTRIENVKKKYNDPLISALIYRMEEKIEQDEVNGNETKVYLQLAKIEHFCGNEKAVRDRIAQSMQVVGMCDDASFVEPMVELVSIASGDGGEKIKNITVYVDQVLDNTAPVRLDEVKTAIGSTEFEEPENEGEQEENNQNGSVTEEFKDSFKNGVVESAAAITISSIDPENFETVEANVIFSGDFAEGAVFDADDIIVRDCGVEIKDFEMEKIEYSGSKVFVACDNSGSMGGSIDKLQDAVNAFIADREDDEEIAMLTFDSGVLEECNFTENMSQIQAIVDGMSARGGTNIYGTLSNIISEFKVDKDKNRIIIVMTDGQDGYGNVTYEDFVRDIGNPAIEKGITVYTIGLGSGVNIEYLTTMAQCTGGDFVFAETGEDLQRFYSFIRGKMNNMYKITYTAIDTLTTVNRTLEIKLKDNTTVRKERNYNIGDEDSAQFALNNGIAIYGAYPKVMYTSKEDTVVKISGEGFTQEQAVSVKLIGNLSYNIETSYEDEFYIKMTIPSGVAPDVYDVEVLIDGKRAYLPKELTIINPGSEEEINFGPYKFTAAKLSQNNNQYILSGNVTMNGWLHFNGEVTLEGDLKSSSIRLIDNSGSYVEYNEGTSTGLAKTMAGKGIRLKIQPIINVTLYNDTDHYNDYENYRADVSNMLGLTVYKVLNIPRAGMYLLPDRIKLTFDMATSKLPFQEQLFTAKGNASPFEYEYKVEQTAVITDKNIGMILDEELEYNKDSFAARYSANINNLPITFDKATFKANTLDDEYSIEIGVACKDLLGIEGAEFGMGWKQGKFDSAKLGIDKKLTAKIGTVPVTFRKFAIAVEDLSEMEKVTLVEVLKSTLKGSLDVEMYNLSETLPGIAEFLDDKAENMCVLSLPETTLSVNFRNMAFSLEAKLMLLKTVELASAKINIGNFTFDNALLATNEKTTGLQASVQKGIKWNNDNLDIEVTGTTEANVHSKFVGVALAGTAKMDLKFWAIKIGYHIDGDALMGIQISDGKPKRFVIAAKYQDDSGDIVSYLVYRDENGKSGIQENYL